MKRKYSPGPWKILDIPTHDVISIYQEKNPVRNFHIATVLDYAMASKSASEAEFERCLANAHLIAAAPELLEALEMLKPLLEEWAIPTDTKERVWKALSKAKGEE